MYWKVVELRVCYNARLRFPIAVCSRVKYISVEELF